MASGTSSLRDQQTQLTRDLIVTAFVTELEANPASEPGMQEIAAKAGVSTRTVYRHFPGRQDLINAVADWITEHRFGAIRLPENLDELPQIFREASKQFGRQPLTVRAVASSAIGYSVGSGPRNRRHEAVHRAVVEEMPEAAEAERRRLEAVLACLSSMPAWVIMHDEMGLNPTEVGDAGAWALQILIDAAKHAADER
jgi:AcrR family transcriptional regulator